MQELATSVSGGLLVRNIMRPKYTKVGLGSARRLLDTPVRAIGMVVIGIVIYHIAVVKLRFVSNYFFIQLGCMLVAFVFCLTQSYIIRIPKYLGINLALICFSFSALVSSLLNKNLSSSSLPDSLIFIIGVLSVFIYFESLNNRGGSTLGLKTFFWLTIVYCMINDALSFIYPQRTVTDYGGVYYTYLVGTKFDVFYLHVLALLMFYVLYTHDGRKRIFLLYALLIYTLAIGLYDQCSTAVFGCSAIFIFFILRPVLCNIGGKSVVVISCIIFCDTVLLFNSLLLQNSFIKHFIENVLHRNTTLTGRTGIYAEMGSLVSSRPFLGYGYENNLMVSTQYLGAANAQNGFFDCLISFGIVGVICLIVLLSASLKQMRGNIEYGFLCLLYFLIFLSMVEISLRSIFFLSLALIAFCQINPKLSL